MSSRWNVAVDVGLDMPPRPRAVIHMTCPVCEAPPLAACWNTKTADTYSSYIHKPREHALQAAQNMYDEIVEAIDAVPVVEEAAA